MHSRRGLERPSPCSAAIHTERQEKTTLLSVIEEKLLVNLRFPLAWTNVGEDRGGGGEGWHTPCCNGSNKPWKGFAPLHVFCQAAIITALEPAVCAVNKAVVCLFFVHATHARKPCKCFLVRVAYSFCCGWPLHLHTCGFLHCILVMYSPPPPSPAPKKGRKRAYL